MLSTVPDIIIGIVVVLVLSASMSTLSSLVLTSSSVSYTHLDVYKRQVVMLLTVQCPHSHSLLLSRQQKPWWLLSKAQDVYKRQVFYGLGKM